MPVLVVQAAYFKLLGNTCCYGVYNISVRALCPAVFQDEVGDFIPFCLQSSPVFLIAQVCVLLVMIHMIALKGLRVLNVYVIVTPEQNLIIDTGFNRIECRRLYGVKFVNWI